MAYYSAKTKLQIEDDFIDNIGDHRSKAYGDKRPPESLENKIKLLIGYIKSLSNNYTWNEKERVHLKNRALLRLRKLQRTQSDMETDRPK